MIPVCEPNLTGQEIEYVQQAIRSGWVSGGGGFVERFEEAVAKACGREWAVATLTGTAALHVALDAEGFRGAEDVPMPSMTFVAGANVLHSLGARPRFHDIDAGHWTPDWQEIGSVVDAAPQIGHLLAKDGGLACLSFNGNKTITTGQGGAVLGDDPHMEKKVRHLCKVAKVKDYEVDQVGFNYGMANVNAALGCAQMERLPEFLERKAEIMTRYREAGLTLRRSHWMAIWETELLGRPPRKMVIDALEQAGIEARRFWTPLHLQKPYERCPRESLPKTDALWHKLVCLPCSTNLTEVDQNKVIDACLSIS